MGDLLWPRQLGAPRQLIASCRQAPLQHEEVLIKTSNWASKPLIKLFLKHEFKSGKGEGSQGAFNSQRLAGGAAVTDDTGFKCQGFINIRCQRWTCPENAGRSEASRSAGTEQGAALSTVTVTEFKSSRVHSACSAGHPHLPMSFPAPPPRLPQGPAGVALGCLV